MIYVFILLAGIVVVGIAHLLGKLYARRDRK